MKYSRKRFLISGLMASSSLLILFLLVSSCEVQDMEEEQEPRGEPYLIEYSPSEENAEVVRIVALEGKAGGGNRFYYSEERYGNYYIQEYGDSLWEALQEVRQKYKVKYITPVNCKLYDASVTRELLVLVEPRK